MRGINKAVEDRFWAKVRKSDGCWEWTGSISRGYGQMSSKRGESPYKAHRLSYKIAHGEIPDGKQINHTCDNRVCVRPDHLYAGTQKENVRDVWERGRNNPESLKNLRPGKKGVHGAGPHSIRELEKINAWG